MTKFIFHGVRRTCLIRVGMTIIILCDVMYIHIYIASRSNTYCLLLSTSMYFYGFLGDFLISKSYVFYLRYERVIYIVPFIRRRSLNFRLISSILSLIVFCCINHFFYLFFGNMVSFGGSCTSLPFNLFAFIWLPSSASVI